MTSPRWNCGWAGGLSADVFPEARKPAYVLHIDFGNELGVRKSSAQLTALYASGELIGKPAVAVVNFPRKQIGPLMSECLVTGFHHESGDVALCIPDKDVPLGTKAAMKWGENPFKPKPLRGSA